MKLAKFRPLPFLGNRHVQTLLGHFLPNTPCPIDAQRRQVALPDGDAVMVHDAAPDDWKPADGIVVLVHGLGGCHLSGYMSRLTARLTALGHRVVRMDLRGVGDGMLLAKRTYHGGVSDDVRAVVEDLYRPEPAAPVRLIGMSLGGNIVLKLAGECAQRPLPNITHVAAVAPPVDLAKCAELIGLRSNRMYERYFVRLLIRQIRRHQRYWKHLSRIRFEGCVTMLDFDNRCTAPRHGFADALDYYRQASSLPVIPDIQLPTLIVTARDDPFVAAESLEAVTAPPNVQTTIMERGGHLGFLGRAGDGGIRWAEYYVVDWLHRQTRSAKPEGNGCVRA